MVVKKIDFQTTLGWTLVTHYTSGIVLIESKERNEFYYSLFSLILVYHQDRNGKYWNANAQMLFYIKY